MTGQLRIEILGPLRVLHHDEPITVGAHRLQTLLAVLALRANRVCTPEELLDLVWHDNPPGTGLKVLPPYIYRLRRALPADVLDRTSDGYVLRLPEGALDVTDFETAAAEAGRLRDSGELDAAAAGYSRALALFRGEPLAGLPGDYLAAQRLRLTERRDKVFADRVDVDLDRGQAAQLIAELVPAAAARPFDEHLAGQLMRALSADGRRTEALDVYTSTRQTLIDQLGIEPGSALREIHQTILRTDDANLIRDELPYTGATFVGREAELDQLTRALGDTGTAAPPVVGIDGMAGAGKTALAVHTARRLADRYPDGLLFVDLHGHTPGHAARDVKATLDHLLTGVGVSATAIPHTFDKAQALWRTTVAGRRLLVILDNAPDTAAVLPLLPGSATCAVLITSRNQLTGLGTDNRLHLGVLAATDASALLTQLVGDRRTADDVAASNDLIERCGRLPLALRIAGARLRHRPAWTVAHVNQRLDRVGRRLTELSTDGLGVATAFELSYQQLAEDQQRLFRLFSLLPGRDLDEYGAAALAGLRPDEASALAESLVDANLLLQPASGRYQFHDLIREYAGDLARSTDLPELRTAAADRLLEYYLQACFHEFSRQEGPWYFDPGPRPPCALRRFGTLKEAKAWADAEADNLVAAVEYSATTDKHARTWQLALAAVAYVERRGKIEQQNRILDLALTAAETTGDREAQARVLHAYGRLIRPQRGNRASVEMLRDAVRRLPADGDLLLRGEISCALGSALRTIDPYGEAQVLLNQAIALGRELGNDLLLSRSLTYLGILYTNSFDHEPAIAAFEEAITLFRRIGPSGLLADALSALTGSYLTAGRVDDAIAAATAGHELAIELDNPFSLPWALGSLGEAYRLRGDLEQAVAIHREALAAAEPIDSKLTTWSMSLYLGTSLLAIGETDEALALYQPVLEASTAEGDHIYVAETLDCLANHAIAVDKPAAAAGYLTQALAIADEYAPRRSERLRAKLAGLTS